MSSFLFEKEEVNCACFESNQNIQRRIFKSQSCYSSSNSSKNPILTMVKKQTNKLNTQKKSLRKQKQLNYTVSNIHTHRRQESREEISIAEIERENQKKSNPKTSEFDYTSTPTFQPVMEHRHRTYNTLRQKPQPIMVLSQHIIAMPRSNTPQHLAFSQPPIQYNQYEKLVQQEFKRDLHQFQFQMDQKIQQKEQNSQKDTGEKQKPINQVNQVIQMTQENQNQLSIINFKSSQNQNEILTQQEIKQLQKFIEKATLQSQQRNQKHKQKKLQLQKIESLPQIFHEKSYQSFQYLNEIKQTPNRRERKESFRNSSISHKGRELAKKIKDKMYAKEIESEKDGSSSDQSDKMSEVVGRGWDGFTEQKLELQELDEMINEKNNSNHTQTMVTQESNIKNSQIKTFTDYSNSFISPKSQYSKPTSSLPFGGGIGKYGITGMSYQHIQDLRKVRCSLYDDGRI